MYYPMYFDPTYMLVIIGVVLCMLASAKMNSTFRRYSNVRSHSGITGREGAERLLKNAGIYDVRVEHVGGNLTDHYDPRSKVLRLSDATYNQMSVAAIGVAPMSAGMRFSMPEVMCRSRSEVRWFLLRILEVRLHGR